MKIFVFVAVCLVQVKMGQPITQMKTDDILKNYVDLLTRFAADNSQLKAAVMRLEGEVAALRNETREMKTNHQLKVSSAMTGFSSMAKSLAELQERMNQTENSVKGLNMEILLAAAARSAIQGDLSNLQAMITKITADLNGAKNESTSNAAAIRNMQAEKQTGMQKCLTTTADTQARLKSLEGGISQLHNALTTTRFCNKVQMCAPPTSPPPPLPQPFDCSDIKKKYGNTKGVYNLRGNQYGRAVGMFCENGYTYLMKRNENSLSFDRTFKEMSGGINPVASRNFWVGLEQMHYMTSRRTYTLRVVVTEYRGRKRTLYADYSTFAVGSASEGYPITIGGYSGTAGDGFDIVPSGTKFTTTDKDNDRNWQNCASLFQGAGWWYTSCGSSLTAPFCGGTTTSGQQCALWRGLGLDTDAQYISYASLMIIPTSG